MCVDEDMSYVVGGQLSCCARVGTIMKRGNF
jgi:hypothetical protein